MTPQTATVEMLLGIRHLPGDSRLGLAHAIQKGLPVSALESLAQSVAPHDARFKFRLVAKATLERRRKSEDQRLSSEEGDRLARLAKVYSFALGIYKDPGKARAFLARPHAMLDDEAPLDVALATGPGADLVINLLGRAAYGGGV
jgi:putative toxin-antitoxin system antitoxin component (TIGR02293 family)